MTAIRHRAAPALALAALLLTALLVYLPGLSGGFLFDDWSNLPALGHQGIIDSFDKLVTYLLSGFSGPTGRPVALGSFLLDANSWPAPPAPFKRTNLLIHLLNGTLLAAFIWQLASLIGTRPRQAAWAAALAAGLWLLHPLWVSTTLYVVQRMTLLAATFTFAGLSAYLHGRRLLFSGRRRAGYLWLSFSIAGCGLLAVLSKENGALLPIFALVIERYALNGAMRSSTALPRGWRTWKALFLLLPSLLLLAYLASLLPALLQGLSGSREFTPGQRLLTESRILLKYLELLLLPRPYSGGLFTDNLALSTGLFQPVTTALSFAVIGAMIILAERWRHRAPALTVAIMFFLAGHLIESTWLQLELYFEHRNYLPAALLFFPLALRLTDSACPAKRTRATIALSLLCLLAAETLIRADLWGRPFLQTLTWARQNMDSPRAQSYLANAWMETGNNAEAQRLMRAAAKKYPNDLLIRINLINTGCRLGEVSPQDIGDLEQSMRTARIKYSVARHQIDKTLIFLTHNSCREIGAKKVAELIEAGLSNPLTDAMSAWRQMLYRHRARLALVRGDAETAYTDFMLALSQSPSFDGILSTAAQLANANKLMLARKFLLNAPRPDTWNNGQRGIRRLRSLWLEHTHYYEREMNILLATLEADIETANISSTSSQMPIQEPSR